MPLFIAHVSIRTMSWLTMSIRSAYSQGLDVRCRAIGDCFRCRLNLIVYGRCSMHVCLMDVHLIVSFVLRLTLRMFDAVQLACVRRNFIKQMSVLMNAQPQNRTSRSVVHIIGLAVTTYIG